MKWFKHDSNAHTDDKLQKILMRYGADGYAIYWYCIELIANRTTPDNITFELKHDAETIGFYLHVDTLRVEKIMADMVELGLFENSNNRITCLKLAKRLDNTMSQNKEIKETLSNFNSLKADKIRIDKKRIEKSKDKVKLKRFTPPAIKELIEHINNPEEAEKFILYYESNGWKVGKNKMANWKSAFTNWVKRSKDYNSPQSSDPYKPWANGMEL